MTLKHQCRSSRQGEWVYGSSSWNERRLLRKSMFVPIQKKTLILKNSGKRSFSYEAKATMSFILMRRMSLWCLIMKEKWLLYESVFVPIHKWTLTLKNNGMKSFSYETKAIMSFIPMSRASLWCLIMKRKEIIMWIHFSPYWQINLDSKKWREDNLF